MAPAPYTRTTLSPHGERLKSIPFATVSPQNGVETQKPKFIPYHYVELPPQVVTEKQKAIRLLNGGPATKQAGPLNWFKARISKQSGTYDSTPVNNLIGPSKVPIAGLGPVPLEPLLLRIPGEDHGSDDLNATFCTVSFQHIDDAKEIRDDNVDVSSPGKNINLLLMLSLSPGDPKALCFTSVKVLVSLYTEDYNPVHIKGWGPRSSHGTIEQTKTKARHLNWGAKLSKNPSAAVGGGKDSAIEMKHAAQSEVTVEDSRYENNKIRWIAQPMEGVDTSIKHLTCSLEIDAPLPLIAKVCIVYEYKLLHKRRKPYIIRVPRDTLEDVEIKLC
ncbi:hypothetical protein BT96DRAFT_1021060 [Gymnopus androsaceus JB14]|uniref:Uncharacterized protein n=1 Tax=Gymnopus androsaceus JB14 TaxID=1447944 RepID=A0A6A4HH32_9AGAR|nr:hypothetical protein BT96DRAFT_1021060 [Gymnopus androsaceus JB14]